MNLLIKVWSVAGIGGSGSAASIEITHRCCIEDQGNLAITLDRAAGIEVFKVNSDVDIAGCDIYAVRGARS